MLKESNSPQLITQMLKDTKDSNGNSLFDHLSTLLSQIDTTSKDSFEFLSDFFKKHRFTPSNLKSAEEVKRLQALVKQENEWKLKTNALLANSKALNNQSYLFRPLTEVAGMLQWAGISFGKKEIYLLDSSIKKLASSVDAKEIKFWGKILTRKSDYFVVQGISGKKNKTEVKGNVEKSGVGVNEYTYWVTHNYLDEWYELPLVTPEQLSTSRLINYIFTGDLNSQISTYPPFPGQQKHLLKAQIVRITHSCQISPKGLFAPSTVEGAAEDDIQLAQQFTYPQFSELKSTQNWVHSYKHILDSGRTSFYDDPTLTQEQRETRQSQFDAAGQKQQRLKPISEDKPLKQEQGFSNWTVRTFGDTQIFKSPLQQQSGAQSTYGVNCLKTVFWPGWSTVSDKQKFFSIYIGYGVKEGQSILSPMTPNDLGVEGQDVDEYPEPNPKQPLDELEPDSDQENKQQQQS